VVGLSREGDLLQINREAAVMLGVRADRIVGIGMREALPPEICTLVGSISEWTCGCQTVLVNGAELQVKGSALVEGAQSGVILTMIRALASNLNLQPPVEGETA
jgi:two-component system NtrC family sensor kinase